jgi:hypothetical protein
MGAVLMCSRSLVKRGRLPQSLQIGRSGRYIVLDNWVHGACWRILFAMSDKEAVLKKCFLDRFYP